MNIRRIDSSSESEAENRSQRMQTNNEVIIDEDELNSVVSMESELQNGHQQPLQPIGMASTSASGCSHGDFCPFKENAMQAWSVSKNLADQYERVRRLENENFQLKNLNTESKNYIATLRNNEESLTIALEEQRGLVLEKDQKIEILESRLNEVIKASKKNAEDAERKKTEEITTLLNKYKRAVEMIADYQKKFGKMDENCSFSDRSQTNAEQLEQQTQTEADEQFGINLSDEIMEMPSQTELPAETVQLGISPIELVETQNELLFDQQAMTSTEESQADISLDQNVGTTSEIAQAELPLDKNVEASPEATQAKLSVDRRLETSSVADQHVGTGISTELQESQTEPSPEQLVTSPEAQTKPSINRHVETNPEATQAELSADQNMKTNPEATQAELSADQNMKTNPETTQAELSAYQNMETKTNPEETQSELSTDQQHMETSSGISKLQIDLDANAEDVPEEIDLDEDDDLMLQLPPSPIPREEEEEMESSKGPTSSVSQPSIALIFKSNFFLDFLENRLPLLENLRELVLKEQPAEPMPPIEEVIKIISMFQRQPQLAILRISKKFGISKNKATLLHIEANRKRAEEFSQRKKRRRESSSESEGAESDANSSVAASTHSTENKIPKELMPWRPTMHVLPKNMRPSALSYTDHRSYVAIIQNYLKENPKFRFEQDKKKIKAWDEILAKERKLYEETALRTINSNHTPVFVYPGPPSLDLVMDCQRKKMQSQLAGLAFQGLIKELTWKNDPLDQPPPLNFAIVELHPGHAKAIKIPDVRHKFMLEKKHNMIRKWVNSKFSRRISIMDDIMMSDYALQNNVSFLMDGSTLRHFLSAPFGSRPQTAYASRVCITREFKGGILRKLCYFFPPVIASRVHRTFISHEYLKWNLKSMMFKDKDSFETKRATKKPKKDDSAQSLLKDLELEGIGKTSKSSSSSSTNVNKRYVIVGFDGSNSESDKHRILVRTNVHGCEDGQNFSMTVKPEFLPEVAAEKLSIEEIMWNIVTALLKGSQVHINFRVHAKELQLLQLDRMANDLTRLDQDTRRMISSRVQRICTLLDTLAELDPGNYLIFQEDEMLRIVTETSGKGQSERRNEREMDKNSLDELEMDDSDRPSSGPFYDIEWFKHIFKIKPLVPCAPFDSYWNGIDPHYPLQWHIVRGQIPGALYPKNLKA